MTREEIKRRAELYSALAKGKSVQVQGIDGSWVDVDIDKLNYFIETPIFRIKPEPKYRPFETKEECWNEMLKHQPFGWVKSPRGELFCIDKVFEEGIVYKHSSCHFNEYLEGQYSFVDGTPFGIKEE